MWMRQPLVEATSKASVRWISGVGRHSEAVSVRGARLMSESASVAPRRESLMDVARPIPLPAPVMRITLFSNGLADIFEIDEETRGESEELHVICCLRMTQCEIFECEGG